MNEADQAQLRRVIDCIVAALGRNAIGVYLYGSAVLGELRPRSDLDVFAVVARAMCRDQRAAVARHLGEVIRS